MVNAFQVMPPSVLYGPFKMTNLQREQLPIIGLFCGAGGLDEGFSQAGFKTVVAADNSSAACDTFGTNHPNAVVMNWDLATITPRAVADFVSDVCGTVQPVGVVGGPPCQAFSQSNVFKDENDPRAKLPLNYAAIVAELRRRFDIRFFVFENVLGLKHRKHAAQLESFRLLFGKAGFYITEHELDAIDFGVPQFRRRLFIVGLNRSYSDGAPFSFPSGSGLRKTVADAIGDLPEPRFFERGLRAQDIPFHPNHWCMNPKSKRFTDGSLQPGELKGRAFRALSWTEPSWTVAYGHREVHIHPSCKRRLSVYEALLLQSFPTTYVLKGTLSEQITQVSDAVPPLLAKGLAESVKAALLDPSDYAASVQPRTCESNDLDLVAVQGH